MDTIFRTLLLKGAKGDRGETGEADSIPTGAIVGYDGETVPEGYEAVSDTPSSWIQKVATTPLTTVARVIDSMSNTNSHTNAPSINAVAGAIADVRDDLSNVWELVYPIGSIYMSTNATSPATLFGGVWEAIEEKFLLGAGNTHTAGSTGGAFSKTISVSGTTGSHVLTVGELPVHNHPIPALSGTASSTGSGHTHTYYLTGFTQSNATQGSAGSVSDEVWTGYKTGNQEGTGSPEGAHSHSVTTTASTTGNTGSATGHSHSATLTGSNDITPPYLSVYMWQRTA